MRMLAIATGAALTASSAAYAQAPADPAAHAVAAQTTSVHTRTITHHDGKKHPQVHKVVHRSTVQTPTGTAVRTQTSTTTTPPK